MYLKKILEELISKEDNPVNNMYLNEIRLKWNRFLNIANDKDADNEMIVSALNRYVNSISNSKYKYSKRTNKGFMEDSPIFTANYIYDLIAAMITKTGAIDHTGIDLDFQSFSVNLRFDPKSLLSMESDPSFIQSFSPKLFVLSQKLDSRFRATGRRNFKRYKLILPLIVFRVFKNLTERELAQADYHSKLAKFTFQKSKTIIITETLDDGFVPNINRYSLDSIFVLRKQYASDTTENISLDVYNALQQQALEYFSIHEKSNSEFKETGIIK